MSVSSTDCSYLGFAFAFVIVVLENICCGDEILNDGGCGGSGTGLKLVGGDGGMNLSNDGGGGGCGGCCGGGMKLLNDGGSGGADKLSLLFLLKLRLSVFSASNLFCMSISPPGRGVFPTRSLVTSFLPM